MSISGFEVIEMRYPRMSKMHFQFIADTLMEIPEEERRVPTVKFARNLRGTNPMFDMDRFMKAVGYRK
jgi:hypothetical protein